MYLAGPRLTEWPVNFLKQAGPYENRLQVLACTSGATPPWS